MLTISSTEYSIELLEHYASYTFPSATVLMSSRSDGHVKFILSRRRRRRDRCGCMSSWGRVIPRCDITRHFLAESVACVGPARRSAHRSRSRVALKPDTFTHANKSSVNVHTTTNL